MRHRRRRGIGITLAFAFAALLPLAAPSGVFAGVVTIGKIVVDKYEVSPGPPTGGVDIVAHYELNGKLAMFKDCFTEANIFWLQRVTSSGATGFTPDPNRPFIDPRSDQPGGFDGLPWYDATFKNKADALANTDRQFGSGPYIMDTPRVLLTRGPYSFMAETLLVVAIDKCIAILGGFSWGFSIGADMKTVTALPLKEIADKAAAKKDFNTALEKDFKDYMIKEFSEIWDKPPTQNSAGVSLAPEPSTMASALAAAALGIVPLARGRRTRRAA